MTDVPPVAQVGLHQLPAPVPTTVQVQRADAGAEHYVVLWVHTPVGVTVAFLDPDTAELVGKAMADTARLARSGLHVAGNGKLT